MDHVILEIELLPRVENPLSKDRLLCTGLEKDLGFLVGEKQPFEIPCRSVYFSAITNPNNIKGKVNRRFTCGAPISLRFVL